MAEKTPPKPEPAKAEAPNDMEAQIAAAKKEAEASAADIIAQAKAEAEKIIADAKEASSDDEVVSRSVSKKDIVDAYNHGMSHMEIARKFYGNVNDDNMQKVIRVISAEFEPLDDIDPEVEVTEAWG